MKRFYFEYVKSRMWLFVAAVFLGIIASAVEPGLLFYAGDFIIDLFKNKQQELLKVLPLAIFIFFTIQNIAKAGLAYIAKYVGEKIIYELRENVFNKCIDLSLDYHQKASTGTLISRVTYDIEMVNYFLYSVPGLIKEPFTIIGLLFVSFIRNWKLTLGVLIITPLCIFLMKKVGEAIKKYSHRIQVQFGDVNQVLQESFYGIQMIQGFNLEKEIKERFVKKLAPYFRSKMKSNGVEVISTPLVDFLGISFICLILFFLLNYSQHKIEAESFRDVATIFIALGMLLVPLRRLNGYNISTQKTLSALERIFSLLDSQPTIQNRENPIMLKEFEKELVFENVSFKYHKDWVLKDISFKVKKGESIALVGASGAGKSTIANVIPLFYYVNEGVIYLDGYNIKDYDVVSIRKNIATVSQESILFNDTIYENIRFGKPEATCEDIQKAAQAAYAHEFILTLPNQYQTHIGDRGIKLSGGQKQRIAIARAILKNAPILILDEATSALDSESERIVQKAFDSLMEGRTVIVIAHRLSTIENVDRILVLDQGHLVEEGTREELLRTKGHFHRFYTLQKIQTYTETAL
ncbi:MAG: ABC transporter ATP-binding protein [Deltaproteobacteria bacterium]|nr:ABC transporter ATP-binding protein [Deltaproteobacteria bacterium]